IVNTQRDDNRGGCGGLAALYGAGAAYEFSVGRSSVRHLLDGGYALQAAGGELHLRFSLSARGAAADGSAAGSHFHQPAAQRHSPDAGGSDSSRLGTKAGSPVCYGGRDAERAGPLRRELKWNHLRQAIRLTRNFEFSLSAGEAEWAFLH